MALGDEDSELAEQDARTEGGRGGGGATGLNAGRTNLPLLSDDEYDLTRYTIGGHYARRRPMWICYDQAQPDRLFLGIRPPGGMSIGYAPNWFPGHAAVPSVEHEPLRLT